MEDTYGYLSKLYGLNLYDIDRPLQHSVAYFLDGRTRLLNLSEIGRFAGRELYEVADYIDKIANPRLVTWSINGERVDRVWIAPSQRMVLEKLIREYKILTPPFKQGSWNETMAALYLVSDPGIGCILTVTIQTAYAVMKYGDDKTRNYLRNLIGEEEPIKLGATWFTEIQGGSDLGANVTEATEENGKWLLNGDRKYFASNAGLADYALVTARPRGAPRGVRGLALFLVPRTRDDGVLNFKVRRLKLKSATVSVPTGEVEFNNTVAYLLGDLENGIYYILENLMISRLANAVAAVGIAKKAELEALLFTSRRAAFGKRVFEHPLAKHDLLDMELLIRGGLSLAMKAVSEYDKTCLENPPYSPMYNYARLLTHIAKNLTAEAAAYVTRLAMELHGGIGFLSEFPVERLHREALITPIWEGTSNIQALDMLEAIYRKNAHKPMLDDMQGMSDNLHDEKHVTTAIKIIADTLDKLFRLGETEVQFNAKQLLNRLGHAATVIIQANIGNKVNDELTLQLSKIYSAKYLECRGLEPGEIKEAIRLVDDFADEVLGFAE